MTQPLHPTTALLHADRHFGAEYGALHQPIHTSVQFGFERVEDLIGVFQGSVKGGYNYARQGSPTTAALESKITAMEGGIGTVSFATGMGALSALFLTLLKAGDHIVASHFVFGNTNSLFGTLEHLGIAVTKVDPRTVEAVESALRPNTRMVFVETIANPGTQIPDLEGIGRCCQAHGVLFVVDNTVTSPALFQPKRVGAGIVMNSLSKTIGGHGAALGGTLTDTGCFDWTHYPNIAASYRHGNPAGWGLLQIRKKGLRDMGATLSGDAAHRIAMGAETMDLRVARTSATAQQLANMLADHPAVATVRYPGLASHPQHDRAQSLFRAPSWLLSFELRDVDALNPVLNRLRLAILATGLGDNRTLVIPVAPTIFWEAGPAERAAMDIPDGLIRVSVGLEAVDDLIADFAQALG